VKTADSDQRVTGDFVGTHLRIGIDSLKQLINGGLTVRHYDFNHFLVSFYSNKEPDCLPDTGSEIPA
jgi:hypothetical protein